MTTEAHRGVGSPSAPRKPDNGFSRPPTASFPPTRCASCAYHDVTASDSPRHGRCCHTDSPFWLRITVDFGTCHLASPIHDSLCDSRCDESLTLVR